MDSKDMIFKRKKQVFKQNITPVRTNNAIM